MHSLRKESLSTIETRPKAVIPANAGIHLRLLHQSNMDSRLRGNDGHEEYVGLQVIGRLALIALPVWS